MEFFIQLTIAGIMSGSIYALIALGFVLIYKCSRILNFAQGELLMLGAYFCLSFIVGFHLSPIYSFLLTILFSILLGFSVERIFLRPLVGRSLVSMIMVTIGISMVFRSIILLIWGPNIKVYPKVISEAFLKVGPANLSMTQIWSFLIATFLIILFGAFFKYTHIGIRMRAVADDQQSALATGVNVNNVIGTSWGVAASVASIGGILLGNMSTISPALGEFALKVFPVVILGGLESIIGAIIGGVMIGIIENLAGGYLSPFVPGGIASGGIKAVSPFIVLLIILMIKPYGLFGIKEIERV